MDPSLKLGHIQCGQSPSCCHPHSTIAPCPLWSLRTPQGSPDSHHQLSDDLLRKVRPGAVGNSLLLLDVKLLTDLPKFPVDLPWCIVSHNCLGDSDFLDKWHQSKRASHSLALHRVKMIAPSIICEDLCCQIPPHRLCLREHCVRIPATAQIWKSKVIELFGSLSACLMPRHCEHRTALSLSMSFLHYQGQLPSFLTKPQMSKLIASCSLRGQIAFGVQHPWGPRHCLHVKTSHLKQYHQLWHWLQPPIGQPESHPLDWGTHASIAESLPQKPTSMHSVHDQLPTSFQQHKRWKHKSPPFSWQTGQKRDPTSWGMSVQCEGRYCSYSTTKVGLLLTNPEEMTLRERGIHTSAEKDNRCYWCHEN